jgi:hypothetical protein
MNTWLTNSEIQWAVTQNLCCQKRERINWNPRGSRTGGKLGLMLTALMSLLH